MVDVDPAGRPSPATMPVGGNKSGAGVSNPAPRVDVGRLLSLCGVASGAGRRGDKGGGPPRDEGEGSGAGDGEGEGRGKDRRVGAVAGTAAGLGAGGDGRSRGVAEEESLRRVTGQADLYSRLLVRKQ